MIWHYIVRMCHYNIRLWQFTISQGPFFKKGILKVCEEFLRRIWHAVVLTQFRYDDSKSSPIQALFFVFFPFKNDYT